MGKHASHPHTTTEKVTIRPQNKYHQTVWKSDNQRFQEATFFQMGRRCRDVENGGEAAEWVVLHSQVVDKNQEGYLGARNPDARPDHTVQVSSTRKINPHSFWL